MEIKMKVQVVMTLLDICKKINKMRNIIQEVIKKVMNRVITK
jgi:hypothetical protein